MVSYKKVKEVLKNWGLENEKIADVVLDENGNISESACYVGEKYVIKFSADLESVERHISLSQAIESVGLSAATPIKYWGILDFDLSERNIRIFDPCYAATAILSESFEADNADKLKQWILIYKNILCGYDKVVKLSNNEWMLENFENMMFE